MTESFAAFPPADAALAGNLAGPMPRNFMGTRLVPDRAHATANTTMAANRPCRTSVLRSGHLQCERHPGVDRKTDLSVRRKVLDRAETDPDYHRSIRAWEVRRE